MISREELIHFKIGYINHVYTSSGGVHEITYVGSETPFSEELTMAKAVDSLSELERPSPIQRSQFRMRNWHGEITQPESAVVERSAAGAHS